MKDFIIKRAIQIIEENLTTDDYARMDKLENELNSRAKSDGFNFNATKKDILKVFSLIEELNLLTFKEKRYLAHIMNLVEEPITNYARQYVDDSNFSEWACCEEVAGLDNNLEEDKYLYYASKYYDLMQNSIWNNNYNVLMDASEALEILAFMH